MKQISFERCVLLEYEIYNKAGILLKMCRVLLKLLTLLSRETSLEALQHHVTDKEGVMNVELLLCGEGEGK